ncbi:hypothetical protein [Streptomyces sp. KL116D]|uniref:hypothetical protein n=1 Tax=Streptomyces sp. KL116D TaxID=3045152 RepID=UPI003557F385
MLPIASLSGVVLLPGALVRERGETRRKLVEQGRRSVRGRRAHPPHASLEERARIARMSCTTSSPTTCR